MTEQRWWTGWLAMLAALFISYFIAKWAPETAPVLVICAPIALALHSHSGPRQPLLARHRKDQA